MPRRSRIAQRPIAIKLSRKRSVGPYVRTCVGLSSALWKNGGSDPDAVWHHRSDESRDEAGTGVWGIGPRKGVLLGANLGRAIVTNGDFTAYVCDCAATRPSQITLGKLVLFVRPPDMVVGALRFYLDSSSTFCLLLSSSFHQLPSKHAERNSIKTGYMLGTRK